MNEDKIIVKLVEIDEKLGTFVTEDRFAKFREKILRGQDTMITILKRLDE